MKSKHRILALSLFIAFAYCQPALGIWYKPWSWFSVADNAQPNEGFVTRFFQRFFVTKRQLEESVAERKQFIDDKFAQLEQESNNRHDEKLTKLANLKEKVDNLATQAHDCDERVNAVHDQVVDIQTVKVLAITKKIGKLNEQHKQRKQKENHLEEQITKMAAMIRSMPQADYSNQYSYSSLNSIKNYD